MNRIIKIGMDVHSKTFNLCAIEANIASEDKILGSTQVTADYHEVVKFIEGLKKKLNTINPVDTFDIECGYEAGCLGFSLRNQLAAMHINAISLRHLPFFSQTEKELKPMPETLSGLPNNLPGVAVRLYIFLLKKMQALKNICACATIIRVI